MLPESYMFQDCAHPMKSNERAMEKWALIRTVLSTSPTMKTGEIVEKLRGQVSRSDVYTFLDVYERNGKIHRPLRGVVMLVRNPSIWDYMRVLKIMAKE